MKRTYLSKLQDGEDRELRGNVEQSRRRAFEAFLGFVVGKVLSYGSVSEPWVGFPPPHAHP